MSMTKEQARWLDDAWLDALGIKPLGEIDIPSWNLTMTDLFCGAGGSSSGAHLIPGVKVVMAANHWDLAIETHNTNHPETDHDCADISQIDPRRYPKTDLLWASPECTNHSQAKGKKRNFGTGVDGELPDEAAQRSRATMWDVVRFAEHHRYRAVIVENVVDVAKWVLYDAWLKAMHALGYKHREVYLNSMHAMTLGLPAPQSRDRLYVVFWKEGERKPDFEKWLRPNAICSVHGRIKAVQLWKKPESRWGRYRTQYRYHCPRVDCGMEVVEPGWLPAAYAIDWSIQGQRIGDRERPLADKTRARIEAGLKKFYRPITLEAAGNTFDAATKGGTYWRAWPVEAPHATLHTTASKGLAYTDGMLVPVEGRDGKEAQSAERPLRTATARNETGLLVPAGGTWNDAVTPTDEVMRTRTTRDSEAIVIPLRNHTSPTPESAPIPTVAAAGNHHGLLVPYYGTRQVDRTTADPMGSLTTVDRYAMVTRHNGTGDWSSTPVDEVLRTLVAGGQVGANQSLTEWDGTLPDIDDCLFRMLEPSEVKVGMAFSRRYVMLGTKREQVRLSGNAVTPPSSRDLIGMVCEAITGELVAA